MVVEGFEHAAREGVEIALLALELLAAAIIVAAALRALVDLARLAGGHGSLLRLRLRFGKGLVLGLEFLVAADILSTIVAPGLDNLLRVIALVLVRTGLAFALEYELRHATDEPEVPREGRAPTR